MGRTRWSLTAAGVLAVLGAGCGSGDPLVGSWATAFSTLGIVGTQTYEVSSNGTLSYTLTGSGTCSGTLTWSGYMWAATATSVTFSGVPQCSGTATCGGFSFDCAKANSVAPQSGACTYQLSDNDDTLALTSCTGTSDVTLIRAN